MFHLVLQVLVSTVGEDGSDLHVVAVPLELVVILHEHRDAGSGEDGRVLVLSDACLGMVVVDDVAHDQRHALVGLQHFCLVDGLHEGAVVLVVLSLVGADVLNVETEHVPVEDGAVDHVGMEALPEDVGGGPSVLGLVLLEAGRSRETEILCLFEEALDVVVHLSELAPVALVDDEDHLLVRQVLEILLVMVRLDRDGHLLDGGADQFLVLVLELLHQYPRVVRGIHAAFLEAVVLLHGLGIQVAPVHEEDDLLHLRLKGKELRALPRGERLAGTGGVENEAALVRVEGLPHKGLGGKYLVRAHDHEVMVGLGDDHVAVDHPVEAGTDQECVREVV